MELDEFFEDVLTHEYDAVKRREYYLKTRQLKGRNHKLVGESLGVLGKATKKPTPKKKTPAQKRAEVTKNLEALKVRLEALRSILKDLVAQAKKRSGVKTPAKADTKTQAHDKKPSKLTERQKLAARKRSKAYYDKNKDTPVEQVKQVKAQIKQIQDKIEHLRAQLGIKSATKDELKSVVSSTSKK